MPLFVAEEGGHDCERIQRHLRLTYKGTNTLPSKHPIGLTPDVPLPNGLVYRCSQMENGEIRLFDLRDSSKGVY
jgi:hypothetical protein